MSMIDELVEAALQEPKKGITKQAETVTSVPATPSWEQLASELEKQAEECLSEEEARRSKDLDGVRMHKLAMATILDTIDDPRCQPALVKLASGIQETVKSAFGSPEPGSVGELAQLTNMDAPTFVKHKVGKGKTLFERLQVDNGSAPTAEEK